MEDQNNNEKNFEFYMSRCEELYGEYTKKPNTKKLTLAKEIPMLVSEGNALLDKEVGHTPTKQVKPKVDAKNPYARAKVMVLEKYDKFQRAEIAHMEQTGNINNRVYNEFVNQILILGDSLN